MSGDDNQSPRSSAQNVQTLVSDLRKNESWASTFTITMLGIGADKSMFEVSCKDMGLDPSKCLVTIQNSAAEMRKVMGVVSQSVSSSANAQTVTF